MVSAATVKRRSVARLAGRKRPSYFESDAEDFDHGSDDEHEIPAGRPSKRRSARQVAARERQATESEDEQANAEAEKDFSQGLPEPPPRRSRNRITKPVTRSKAQSRAKASPAKSKKKSPKQQRALGAPLKKKSVATPVKKAGFLGPSDGKIPDWGSLPLDVLRDIFVYASQPLVERSLAGAANATWLMRTARICRAFAQPALEAYYECPPVHNAAQPHYLLELMRLPKEKTFIDYAVKVKSLDIDVTCLSHTATGKPLFNLSDLVRTLPRLQHLELSHPIDSPPYRAFRPERWSYPPDLFDALNETGIQLRTWSWSRHLFPNFAIPASFWPKMLGIHRSRAFARLTQLILCGFSSSGIEDSGPSALEPAAEPPTNLATAICALSDLEDLTFISCDLVMDAFLPRLPRDLKSLELTNCLEVHSTMLSSFLQTHGSHLIDLSLNHDPALNLSFLPSLKASCPKLEHLEMDLTYYSERHTFNDAFAMYDELLARDEIPSWPTTLSSIALVHLQHWSSEAAQNLFQSLVDAAGQLPCLQHLTILAHIDIPWRDRAGFRDMWIERLKRVFLRSKTEPDVRWSSLKLGRLWREAVEKNEREAGEAGRQAVRVDKGKGIARDDGTSETGLGSPTSNKFDGLVVQGRCNVVDVAIDNQRPREKQWTEQEFLDSEASGDEDWQEGADYDDGDDRYAF